MTVQGLKGGRAGDPPVICVEDLKGWLREAKRKKDLERRIWEFVVRLMQVTFGDGDVPKEVSWATMFLLPKVKGGHRGIGLVEVCGRCAH